MTEKHKHYEVTLIITSNTNPAKWDWDNALLLTDNEELVEVSVKA